jgi:hypothetical protein
VALKDLDRFTDAASLSQPRNRIASESLLTPATRLSGTGREIAGASGQRIVFCLSSGTLTVTRRAAISLARPPLRPGSPRARLAVEYIRPVESETIRSTEAAALASAAAILKKTWTASHSGRGSK